MFLISPARSGTSRAVVGSTGLQELNLFFLHHCRYIIQLKEAIRDHCCTPVCKCSPNIHMKARTQGFTAEHFQELCVTFTGVPFFTKSPIASLDKSCMCSHPSVHLCPSLNVYLSEPMTLIMVCPWTTFCILGTPRDDVSKS